MSQTVSIHFGADRIFVVRACRHRQHIQILQTQSFADEEFDEFLTRDRCRSYIVCVDFDELIQETVHVPPADKKLFPKLMQASIRKMHPGIADHPLMYEVVEDILEDGKVWKKVACFVYSKEEIEKILARFINKNKKVSGLYSNAFALSRMVQAKQEITEDAVLCINAVAREKTIFLLKNKSMLLVRHIKTDEPGMDDAAIHNINMTVDYCLQSLRIRPTKLIILGRDKNALTEKDVEKKTKSSLEYGLFHNLTSIPFEIPSRIKVKSSSESINWELYWTAVGALFCSASESLSPPSYRQQLLQLQLYHSATYTCIAANVVVAAFLGLTIHSSQKLQRKIELENQKLVDASVIVEKFQSKNCELNEVLPGIGEVNNAALQAKFAQALIVLQCLDVAKMHTRSLHIVKQDLNALHLEVKGDIESIEYSRMQENFERLIASIKLTKNLEVTSQKMDPVGRMFMLELIYRI